MCNNIDVKEKEIIKVLKEYQKEGLIEGFKVVLVNKVYKIVVRVLNEPLLGVKISEEGLLNCKMTVEEIMERLLGDRLRMRGNE